MMLRILSRRLLIGYLCLTFSLLGGCASTTEKTGDAVNPEITLSQARKAYFEQRYTEVFELVFPLAMAGNDQAQYVLGYLYANGLGVEKNDQQAMQWIQRSAAQGNKKALQALQ